MVGWGSGRQNSIPTITTIPTVPTIPTIPTPWGSSKLKPIASENLDTPKNDSTKYRIGRKIKTKLYLMKRKLKLCYLLLQGCTHFQQGFSLNWPNLADSVIESQCPCVRLSAPLDAFFPPEASHWP